MPAKRIAHNNDSHPIVNEREEVGNSQLPTPPTQVADPEILKPALLPFPTRHREYIIENGIMPRREVHILAAASGVGKTTLVIQLIDDLIDAVKVFDAPTHPIHPAYLCNDRSADDLKRTFERIQPTHTYPSYSLLTDPKFKHSHTIFSSLALVKAEHAEVDFVVFDPISQQVENVNNAKEVSNFLRKLTACIQELNITLLILHHTAKVKTDALYASPRQKMAGCGAWGGYSNLNLILEEDDESTPTNPLRGLHVCPRNGANQYFRFALDETGCFTPFLEVHEAEIDYPHLYSLLPPVDITPQLILEALGDASKGALYRTIERWLREGLLIRTGRGKYAKTIPQKG